MEEAASSTLLLLGQGTLESRGSVPRGAQSELTEWGPEGQELGPGSWTGLWRRSRQPLGKWWENSCRPGRPGLHSLFLRTGPKVLTLVFLPPSETLSTFPSLGFCTNCSLCLACLSSSFAQIFASMSHPQSDLPGLTHLKLHPSPPITFYPSFFLFNNTSYILTWYYITGLRVCSVSVCPILM